MKFRCFFCEKRARVFSWIVEGEDKTLVRCWGLALFDSLLFFFSYKVFGKEKYADKYLITYL